MLVCFYLYNCNSAEVPFDVRPEGGSVDSYIFFKYACACVCILFFVMYKVLNPHSASKGTILVDHHSTLHKFES